MIRIFFVMALGIFAVCSVHAEEGKVDLPKPLVQTRDAWIVNAVSFDDKLDEHFKSAS